MGQSKELKIKNTKTLKLVIVIEPSTVQLGSQSPLPLGLVHGKQVALETHDVTE